MTIVDEFKPQHNINVETLFWQHRSPFLASQEQLDELKRDAENRAGMRYYRELTDMYRTAIANERPRPSVFDKHRPATARLVPIVHVGLVPLLWKITTCKCGDRWPCHIVTQHIRDRFGWTIDINEHLDRLTRRLPKPVTRWRRFWGAVSGRRTRPTLPRLLR